MSKYEHEYNLRQLRLMLGFIHEYQEGAQTLRALIDDLEALSNCLQNPEKSWIERFQSEWGVLEDIYAVMRYEKRTQLTDVENRLIEEAIIKLNFFVQSEIKRLEKEN